jgi:hypothetical protein
VREAKKEEVNHIRIVFVTLVRQDEVLGRLSGRGGRRCLEMLGKYATIPE